MTNLLLEKVRADAHDVVEQKHAIRLFDEQYLFILERKELMVLAQERSKALFEKRSKVVRKMVLIALLPHHAGAEVKVQHARLHAKPVVVPARKEPKAVVLITHREVPDVPIDQHGDLLELVIPQALGVGEKEIALRLEK